MPLDLSEPKSVKALANLSKITDTIDGETLKYLMNNTSGRAFVWRKLEDSSVFVTTFNDSPMRMAFNEGRRAIGLKLWDDILRHCPDQYSLMMREANERRSANERAFDQDGDGDNKGPDERQLDLYRDLTGVTVEYPTDTGPEAA